MLLVILSIILLLQFFILNQIFHIKKQNKLIMAKQDQVDATLAELNDATNALAAKIQKLIDGQVPGDPVSQESLDALQVVADKLKAMGTDPTNPVPPVTG